MEELAGGDDAVDVADGGCRCVVGGWEPGGGGELAAAGFELFVEARHDCQMPDFVRWDAVFLA